MLFQGDIDRHHIIMVEADLVQADFPFQLSFLLAEVVVIEEFLCIAKIDMKTMDMVIGLMELDMDMDLAIDATIMADIFDDN